MNANAMFDTIMQAPCGIALFMGYSRELHYLWDTVETKPAFCLVLGEPVAA